MDKNPIKKRLLINIALFASVALLIVAVWLSPDQEQKKRLSDKLDADDIIQIRIQQTGNVDIIISKVNNNWQITEPVNTPASPFRINGLLNIAQEKSHADYAISDIDPTELGLDNSSVTLYLNEHKIRFGDKDPIYGRRYTQFNDRLHLLDDYYLPLLTQSLTSFIDTHILPEYLNITEYQLPDFKISQTETGGWKIEPDDSALGADAIQEWVNRWHKQRATEIIYEPKIEQIDTPQIVLQLANGNTILFQLIQTEAWSGLYWPTQKIGYKLSAGAIELLSGKPQVAIPEKKTESEK